MKQDYTRDYITECFRYYANVKAGRKHPETEEEIADVAAAADTLAELSGGGKKHIADAIQAVYMVDPHKPMTNSTVSLRVRRLAIAHAHADERTVYRWLKEGRKICAKKRKLRCK